MIDDPMSVDFERLLGEDYQKRLSSEEQRRRIERAVSYDQFAPTQTPTTIDSTQYNPAIEGYRDAGLSWGDEGWEPIDNTDPLSEFPEYVPTDQAIQTLVDLGPVLEVGAGNGYWAHVVNENGGDCLPTDLHPQYTGGKKWTHVREADGVDAVNDYPNRAVVMCHPSGADRWSERVLDAITTQPFVFIGAWFPGPDANPWFFKRLAENWTLSEEFPIYNWASSHAHGYVFTQD